MNNSQRLRSKSLIVTPQSMQAIFSRDQLPPHFGQGQGHNSPGRYVELNVLLSSGGKSIRRPSTFFEPAMIPSAYSCVDG
jgi:hypothetical protein